MKLYQLFDVQNDEVNEDFARATEVDIIGYAYHIMKDRAEAVADELADEFNEVIKDGPEGVSFDKAVELLNDWEYEVYEINGNELNRVGRDIQQYYQ
jgi:hypothetical protein